MVADTRMCGHCLPEKACKGYCLPRGQSSASPACSTAHHVTLTITGITKEEAKRLISDSDWGECMWGLEANGEITCYPTGTAKAVISR